MLPTVGVLISCQSPVSGTQFNNNNKNNKPWHKINDKYDHHKEINDSWAIMTPGQRKVFVVAKLLILVVAKLLILTYLNKSMTINAVTNFTDMFSFLSTWYTLAFSSEDSKYRSSISYIHVVYIFFLFKPPNIPPKLDIDTP